MRAANYGSFAGGNEVSEFGFIAGADELAIGRVEVDRSLTLPDITPEVGSLPFPVAISFLQSLER
jgi:hypothetical protein